MGLFFLKLEGAFQLEKIQKPHTYQLRDNAKCKKLWQRDSLEYEPKSSIHVGCVIVIHTYLLKQKLLAKNIL